MTCNDCIHDGVCWKQHELLSTRELYEEQECCVDASRYIQLPCKVGDTVFIIDSRDMLNIDPSVCSVVDDEIYEMCYGRTQSGDMKWLFLVYETGEDFYEDEIGKFVFLTREDAEKALTERSATDE